MVVVGMMVIKMSRMIDRLVVMEMTAVMVIDVTEMTKVMVMVGFSCWVGHSEEDVGMLCYFCCLGVFVFFFVVVIFVLLVAST